MTLLYRHVQESRICIFSISQEKPFNAKISFVFIFFSFFHSFFWWSYSCHKILNILICGRGRDGGGKI